MKLEEEIKQSSFKDELVKADVNLFYTASWLNVRKTNVLKKYNISLQQFNILRILRGLKGQPATVKMLTERMIDKCDQRSLRRA